MLKNKIFGRKIRNFVILLMVILIMFGIYRFIRNSLAENIVEFDAIALDNYGYLADEEFKIEAKEISEDLFEIETPESVNGKKINNLIKMALGDEVLELTDNKVQLTKEQLDSGKINLEVSYDMAMLEKDENGEYIKTLLSEKSVEERKQLQITEETEVLYSKILRYEDKKNEKLVEVKGFLPRDAKLQVEQVSQEKLTEIFGKAKIDVAYDIKIVIEVKTEVPVDELDPSAEQEYIIETIEINPEDFGEKCEVSIKDVKIEEESQVYHVKEDNTYEQVTVTDNTEENISFEANTFSIYAITSDEGIMATAATAVSDYTKYIAETLYEGVSGQLLAYNRLIKLKADSSGYVPEYYTWIPSTREPESGEWYTSYEYSDTTPYAYTVKAKDEKDWYLNLKLIKNSSEKIVRIGPFHMLTNGMGVWYFTDSTSNSYINDGKKVTFNTKAPSEYKIDSTTYTNNTISSSAALLEWSTSNTDGVDGMTSAVSNGTNSYYQTLPSNVESTSYYLRAKGWVKTNAGQRTVYTVSGPYKIDTRGPSVDATKNNGTVTVTATDGGVGLASSPYSYDGGSTWTSSNTYTNTGTSSVNVTLVVKDTLGNKTTASVELPPNDTTAPTGTVSTSATVTNQSTITVYVSNVSDNTGGTGVDYVQIYGWYGTTWVKNHKSAKASYDSTNKRYYTTFNFSDLPDTSSGSTNQGDGTYTFDAAVYDKVGNKGNLNNVAVTYDTTRPNHPTMTKSPTTDWSNGNVTVTITAGSDSGSGFDNLFTQIYNESYEKIDGTGSTSTSQTTTRTISDEGKWKLGAWNYDKAGNVSDSPNFSGTGEYIDVWIDKTAPTSAGTLTMKLGSSSGSTYTSGNWTNQSVYVVIGSQGADALSGIASTTYTIKKDGTTYKSAQTSATTLSDSGTYTITLTATDNAGNTKTSSEYTVKIDKTAPTVGTVTMKKGSSSGSTYTSGTWTNGSVYVKVANGSDSQSGHSSTTYTIDGGSSKSTSTTTTVSDSGKHTLVVTTEDNAGNTATAEYEIWIDKVVPVISTSSEILTMKYGSASGSTYTSGTLTNNDIYIALNTSAASDALSGVASITYSVDGGSEKTSASTISTSGTHTVVVTVTDNAGNEATKSYTVDIDKTKPTWDEQIYEGSYSNGTYSLQIKGTDDREISYVDSSVSSSITVKVDGEDATYTVGTATLSTDKKTMTVPITIKNFEGGTVSITISANALVDTAWNSSAEKTYTFSYDATPPVWDDEIQNGTFSLSAQTYKFNLVGSDESALNATSSTLNGKLTIKVGQTESNMTTTTNYTIGSASTSGNTKTFPVTIKGFTGGYVSIEVAAGALVDTTGNTSAKKTYDTFWIDGERPVWNDSIIDGTYNADAGTYTLKFQGTDNVSLNETTLSASNVRVLADGTQLTNLTFGNVVTSGDSKTKTFPLTINNFPGGNIEITISAGALVDPTGNTSEKAEYEFFVDGVKPVWDEIIHNGNYTKPATEGQLGTYYFELKGSDDEGLNNTLSTLNSTNLSITVGGQDASFTVGETTLNNAIKTFPITINNFTGGEVIVTIEAEALVDTSGNKSIKTIYPAFIVDITDPVWEEDVVNTSYNSSEKKFTVTLSGSDENALSDEASVLNTSNTTITIDGTETTNWTVGTTSITDGKTKTFPIILSDFTGGTVKINITEGGLVDTTGNLSAAKEYSFEVDVTPPEWQEAAGVYNPDDQSYTITVTGTDNAKLDNVSSDLNTSNITLTVGTTTITPTVTTTSATTTAETYTITWPNHTGEVILLKINAGALVDATDNTSAEKEYTFGVVDATKPVWDASISNATYTLENDDDEYGTFTFDVIGRDETALNDDVSTLNGNITIKTGKTQDSLSVVNSSNITIGTTTLTDDKVKTFPIEIKEFNGGYVEIIISANALVDITGNKSNTITYSFYRDVTRPEWDKELNEALYNPTTSQYTFNLVGSDETELDSTSSVLSSENVTITIDGTETSNVTFGETTLSENTKKFPVTISGYSGGEVVITINKGALVDGDGNVSLLKEYKFIPDIDAPTWSYENLIYNPDDVSYSVELVGTDEDEINSTLSTLIESGDNQNITVICGETTVTPTIEKITTDSTTEVRYKLTIKPYPGGVVTINIDAGALIDASSNQSIATEITLPEKDIEKPTITAQNPVYSSADKTYTFELVAQDNIGIDDTKTTLTANGETPTVTVICPRGSIEKPTISIKEISGTQIIYQVTIQNYPAGVVNVSIIAGAVVDTTGNKNVATELTLPALDIAKPLWQEENPIVNYDEDAETVQLSLIGTDETSLNDEASTLTLGDSIKVYIGGAEVTDTNKVVLGTTSISNDQLTKTFPITIKNFTGGIIEISLSSGALKDNSGKISDSKIYTFTDIIKPKWTIAEKGTYNHDTNIYTIDLYVADDTALATADLASNLTVYVDSDGDGIEETESVTPTVTLINEGELQKTYTVTIPSYLGGMIGFQIAEGAATDDVGNLSAETYFTKIPDITRPIWEVGNVEFDASSDEIIIIDLYGSDETLLADSSLAKNNITVKFGDTVIDRSYLQLTGPTSSNDEKGGVIYQLTISGYNGEDMTIVIAADTLTDDSGNKSVTTTITSESIIPDSDDDVPTVTSSSYSVDAINGYVIIDFEIKDSWYNFDDLITTGEYTISAQNYSKNTAWGTSGSYSTVDTSSATITILKEIRIAKGYRYRIRIEGLAEILETGTTYEVDGYTYTEVTKYPLLTVTLNAGAATDRFEKTNVATNLMENAEIDFSVGEGEATITLTGVRTNKTLEEMYIELNATWTESSSGGIGNWWGSSSSSGTTDFSLTSDMITALTIDEESILDYIKETDAGRLTITNGTTESTTTSSGWYSSSTVYNKPITITLSDLVQDSKQAGKDFLEWSGNVSLTLTPGESTTFTFEEDVPVTANQTNVLFADLIDPQIQVLSSTVNDESINSVTVQLKATDKYFVPGAVFTADKVKLSIDGEYATAEDGVTLTFGIQEELFANRNSVQEQYGIIQNVTITGIGDKLDKRLQLVLETGAIADLSGNISATKRITLFNWLKSAATETSSTSAFLGITDASGNAIPRQSIESVEFLDTIEDAPSTVISAENGVFDVSDAQDESIIAWYTGTGPYQVYIASEHTIYANPDSSYLFSYIAYDSTCTDTTVLKSLNLLNTIFAKDMSYMFMNTGFRKMTSLTLESNFNTANVTNMKYMFWACGYTAMTTLNLGDNFHTKKVTDMSNMFEGCGYTAMTTLNLGNNFDTSNVTGMNSMFSNCGRTAMTSLDLGDKFYTTSATDMSNMFNGCGKTAMTILDLGPAFTKIADTYTDVFGNCGKSGEITIYAGSSIYSSKNAFKLNADSNGTISFTTGTIVPRYKPEWTKTYAAYDADDQKLIVRLQGNVNATNYGDAIKTVISSFRNGVLEEDSTFANQIIRVRIDGEEVSTIEKELSLVESAQVGETVTCEIILTNFVQTTKQTGKSYFEWAGNVALQIAEEMLVDSYGNRALEQSDEATGTMQNVEIKDDATTDHMIDTMMFVDFVRPVITYEYSEADIDHTAKTAKIVFNVTDKYYASESLSLDNLTILMDGTNLKQTPVQIGLTEEDITEDGTTIGRKYTITLEELQQDIIATGKSYLDFSGPVTIAVPGGVVADKSGNTNNAKTITVGVDEKTYADNTDDSSLQVVDVVSPMWTNVANGVTLDFANKIATVKVKATDKYFDTTKCLLTSSNIKFYLDGVETTAGISITVSDPTSITEERTVNGATTTVTIGYEYTITLTGITLDSDQAKLEIVAGTVTDLYGNVSDKNEIILYNRLRATNTEKTTYSPFLGNTTIQRENIENVTFVSGIAGANETKWDVSAAQDESIIAWYETKSSGALKVYIGSEGRILANRDSSYLFAYIGYGVNCTATEVITNLELLDTSSVTNMQAMFWFCGYRSMTSLDLGTNFDTSKVINMREMFAGCGYNALTSFEVYLSSYRVQDMSWMFADFGYKALIDIDIRGLQTESVTDMSYMFYRCGYTALQSLNLSNFDTSQVTDMSYMFAKFGYTALQSLDVSWFDMEPVTDTSYMFYDCGHDNMTTLTLGNNFNTSAVTNMNSMFKGTGASKMQSLSLGGMFYTSQVTDMTDMFYGCGEGAMTTLDLGPAFTVIPSTHSSDGKGFAANCGVSGGITIYTGSAIYANQNAFRLGASSDTEISFTRGTINPKYKPEWTMNSSEISGETLVITLEGKVDATTNYANYMQTVTNKFTNGTTTLVNVSIDGEEEANDVITKTISDANSTEAQTVTCKLTLANFVESKRQSGKDFLEWSGDIALEYLEGSLQDYYGNPNLDQADDDTTAFVDFIKPKITYEYAETEINYNTKTVTIYFNVTDKNFNGTSSLATDTAASLITVTVGGVVPGDTDGNGQIDGTEELAISKALSKVEDLVYGTDNQKVGERYKLVISNLDKGFGVDYSGIITLALPAEIAQDKGPEGDGTTPNKNDDTTITIGIDDSENPNNDGHNSGVIVDVVDPIWKIENLNVTTVDLIATDKYLSEYPATADALKALMQVKVGETDIISQVTITGPTEVTNGQKYTLTVPDVDAIGEAESYEDFLEEREKYEQDRATGRPYREQSSGSIIVTINAETLKDASGNTNKTVTEFDMGSAADTLDPETIVVSVENKIDATDISNSTQEIIFDVTDKNFQQMNYTLAELEDRIHVFIDNVETSSISKQLTEVEELMATVNGNSYQVVGIRYKLVLSNFETTGLEDGRRFKGLSGTVSIGIDEGIVTDQAGNTNKARTIGKTTDEEKPLSELFADFIKPDVVYRHSETIKVWDANSEVITEVSIVFDITDKYYDADASGTLSLDELTIMIQDGTVDTNYIDLKTIATAGVDIVLTPLPLSEDDEYGAKVEGPFNKTTDEGIQLVSNEICGQSYQLTIRNLQKAEIVTGRNYLDYSGNVTIEVPGDVIKDKGPNGDGVNPNANVDTTITMGIDLPEETGNKEPIDMVRPTLVLESQTVDLEAATSTFTIRATDKYFAGSTLDTGIQLLYSENGVETSTQSGVTIVSTTPIYEEWTINEETTQVQIGATYVIQVTGFDTDKQKAKIRIPTGTILDISGNKSEQLDIVLYSTLMSASGETLATEGDDTTRTFLGNTSLQRKDIESITFVSGISGANDTKWDVSAAGDGSIMAWYTGSGPYQVTIGCEGAMFANSDSSYLFSYIGSGSDCDETTVINSLNLLNTSKVTSMSYMFAYCGAQAMTSFDLDVIAANFNTSNVTSMLYMFEGFGKMSMTSFDLGSNFDTSKVTGMDGMFKRMRRECNDKFEFRREI